VPSEPTVRDATIGVLRRLGLTTIFSNPGSTEVPFLVDLPDDIEFVLALHEGSVVGMAAGYAIAAARPRSPCCTRRRGWGTPSPRSRPRGRTGRLSS
jgi:glyoxylate carboligase